MEYGQKAKNLLVAKKNGIKVPSFFSFNPADLGGIKEKLEDNIDEMLDQYSVLAVRSSTEIEDGEHCSAAGIFESYIGIDNKEDVYKAIDKCQQSFHSLVGQKYSEKHGKKIGAGVIIQQCIQAKRAGVIVTDKPKEGELLIEICWGFAENLVSGKINPELWKCYRKTSDKYKMVKGRQRIKRVWDTNMSALKDVYIEDRSQIADEHLLENLIKFEREIYSHFGQENEIEWVEDDNGEIWLVQIRPLTCRNSFENF